MKSALSFAHFSDVHLTSRPRLRQLGPRRMLGWLNWLCFRRHCHRPQELAVAVQAILSSPPAAVFLTGDLTQLGLPQEIESVRLALAPLSSANIPVFMVRGNHDVYDDDPEARAAWEKTACAMRLGYEPDETGVARLGEMEIVLLEQTLPKSRFFSWGEVGGAARQRLGARLAVTPPPAGRIALGHYPISLPNGRRLPWGYRLRDDQQLESILASARCAVYCCGHVHRPYTRLLSGGCWQCCAGAFGASGIIYRFALSESGQVRWEYCT